MDIQALQKMLAQGQDSVILRFGLGQALLHAHQPAEAAVHLKAALEMDADYSAAWKLLGKALAADGDREQAIAAYNQGISVAEKKGDIQAAREMQVFLKRLLK